MEPSTTLRHGAIRPPLRLAGRPGDPQDKVEQLVHRLREREAARATSGGEERDDAWFDALRSAEERAQRLAHEVEQARGELGGVRVALVAAPVGGDVQPLARPFLPRLDLDLALRGSVLALLAGLLTLIVWAGVSDYALRVTSDTPTFIALVTGMAERPFQEQSPFLANQVATQHATPYIQAVAFLWSFLGGGERDPVTAGRLLALIGIPVFALLLYSVFLYARRLAGSRAAWLSLPVLLGIFGPPHVIWASDQSLHGALYASYFPQNLAIAMLLLTLLALERNSYPSLALACLGAATTMLVHPFSGVLLCLLATFQGCYMALRGKPGYYRAPVALTVGFALGLTWPAYSLDRAFAETGMRGVFFVALCAVSVFAVHGLARIKRPTQAPRALSRLTERLSTDSAALRLAVVGAVGTALVAIWEVALVHSPPGESARLAIYWVDDRWRWPLLLIAGTVGISGLARLVRKGYMVPAAWFAGCLGLGLLGAIGLPIPVWYRFLLLCQIPLAIGVAAVLANARRTQTLALVLATFSLAIGVKVATLFEAPPTVSYFGSTLQPVWKLGAHIPPGSGLVATDPKTAYFIPAATGHRVLTLDKAHASSRRELAFAANGYRLLRKYYAGGPDWWQAGQEMWRRGVRYVVVEKHTTLQPKTLAGFTWQSSMLRTASQRRGLSQYFYENNRVGELVFDSPDYAVYKLDPRKLLGRRPSGTRATHGP
jgi:hypothetical protein